MSSTTIATTITTAATSTSTSTSLTNNTYTTNTMPEVTRSYHPPQPYNNTPSTTSFSITTTAITRYVNTRNASSCLAALERVLHAHMHVCTDLTDEQKHDTSDQQQRKQQQQFQQLISTHVRRVFITTSRRSKTEHVIYIHCITQQACTELRQTLNTHANKYI
jgi:hypothetical protein